MIKSAKWITSPRDAGQAVYHYRKQFVVEGEVVKATLYATAMGVYTPYLNGRIVGNGVLVTRRKCGLKNCRLHILVRNGVVSVSLALAVEEVYKLVETSLCL